MRRAPGQFGADEDECCRQSVDARLEIFSKEQRRRRAINLRLKGLQLEEIEERLGYVESAWVIGKWCRESGEIKYTREQVIDLSSQRPKDIAERLGISLRHVQRILREVGGDSRFSPPQNTLKENIDLLFSDPRAYMTAEFTQSNEFGVALLKRCVDEVDINPIKGLDFVEISTELLDRVRHTRRDPKRKREALCCYLQSRGIEAHVYRVTNRYDIALYLLNTVFKMIDNCVSCEADYYLRCSRLYRSCKRWDEAESALLESERRYAKLPGCGHDLLGNGRAHCQVARSALRYFTVCPEAGAAEARKGLAMLRGGESPKLFASLAIALANCLISSGNLREIQEAEEALDWCFANLHIARTRSSARTILYWLKGQLLVLKDKRIDAMEYLTLALEDAHYLRLEEDIGCILADLGALNPAPREIRGYIEDFCECQWSDEKKEEILVVPSWCKKLEDKIRFLYDLSRKSRYDIDLSVLSDLRTAAGGERRMPSFVLPPPPTKSTGLEYWDAVR